MKVAHYLHPEDELTLPLPRVFSPLPPLSRTSCAVHLPPAGQHQALVGFGFTLGLLILLGFLFLVSFLLRCYTTHWETRSFRYV